jgi:hypothetical protein
VPIRILERPESPWGDYGDILRHGMTSHLGPASDGLAQLERTGPFVPLISFPGFDIVVTDGFRTKLAESGFKRPRVSSRAQGSDCGPSVAHLGLERGRPRRVS